MEEIFITEKSGCKHALTIKTGSTEKNVEPKEQRVLENYKISEENLQSDPYSEERLRGDLLKC